MAEVRCNGDLAHERQVRDRAGAQAILVFAPDLDSRYSYGEGPAMVQDRHRPLHSKQPGKTGLAADARGEQARSDPARDLRSYRASADARRDCGISKGH